jgi:hypothetical protein
MKTNVSQLLCEQGSVVHVIQIGKQMSKRNKNWSEDETTTFISVWSEHYAQLMAGGSRNTPIYHAMAQQLNQILSPRTMTATDVKSKIGNLVAEYRKKKKENGKTGASPPSWRYFEQIDKLLGENGILIFSLSCLFLYL